MATRFVWKFSALALMAAVVGLAWSSFANTEVLFNANGGEGEMEPFVLVEETEQTLPKSTFTKEGHFLLGWALTPNGEATLLDGDSTADIVAAAGETVTLYAVWHEGLENYHGVEGLVAWYSFDGDASDSSGNGNNGVVNGATLVADRNGRANSAYSFDGNDTITVASSTTIMNVLDTMTIATWVNFDQAYHTGASWIPILCKGARYRQFSLNINTDGGTELGDGVGVSFETIPQRGVWTHVAVTLDGNHLATAYINGVPVGIQQNGHGLYMGYEEGMVIGSDPCGDTEYLYGSLDDLSVWNCALSSEEIAGLYAGRFPCSAYAIRFDANGGEGTMTKRVYATGEDITLPANVFTRDGWVFAGWATEADGPVAYADEEVVEGGLVAASSEATTLYARWSRGAYSVHFDANGGEGVMDDETYWLDIDGEIPKCAFTKEGHFLLGWALTPDGDATLLDGDSTADLAAQAGQAVTLYAVWHEGECGGMGLSVKYYDIASISDSNWHVQVDTYEECIAYHAAMTPTIVTNSFDIGDTLDFGDNNSSTAYFHGKYAQKGTENFVMLLEGTMAFEESGNYSFQTKHDDGCVFYMDGNAAYSRYNAGGWNTFSVDVDKGRHNVLIAMHEGGGGQSLRFQMKAPSWSSHSGLPQSVLSHGDSAYAIRFDANGGTGTMAKRVYAVGEDMTLPAMAFERDGWTFLGWGMEANGPVVFADEEAFEGGFDAANGETTTLYARWGKDTYTVHFNANGGEGAMANQTMWLGVPDTLTPNAFTRTGYTFAGWATAADGDVAHGDGALVTNLTETANATVNLYAVWSPNHYQVRFNSGSGTGSMPNQTITYDAATALSANTFAKTGYHFAGWATEADGEAVYGDCGEALNFAAGEGDVVDLYATWAPNGYTVVFDANGGAGTIQPQQFTYDEEQALTANAFTRASRFFAGWATAANGAVAYADCAVVSNLTTEANGEVRLYAVWADSRVVFDADGGEGSMGTFFVFSGTEQTLPQVTFTKDGCFLLGWARTPDGEATLLDSDTTAYLAAQAGETVTLYAVWHEGEGGGNGLSVKYYDISSSGYSTWTQSEAAMTNYFAAYTPTIVTNSLDFGESLSPSFASLSSSYLNKVRNTGMTTSEYEGNGLSHFHGKYAYNSTYYFSAFLAGDIRIPMSGEYSFAVFADDYTALYIDGILTCGAAWDQISQGNVELSKGKHRLAIAFREDSGGHGLFIQWKKNDDSSYSPIPQSFLSHGNPAYAIRFDANGGAGTMEKRVYAAGEDMALPALAFERDGWTFVGWGTEADGPVVFADEEAFEGGFDAANGETVTLYARWSRGQYAVHYDANGGNGAMADESLWLGIPDSLPLSTFTRTGYTFAGWATAANGDVEHGDGAQVVDLVTAPNGEATLYAVWSPHEWTIRFFSEDDFIGSQVFAYDSPEALDGNTATKTGYTFVGWATEDGSEKAYDDGEEILNLTTEDGAVMDFFAIWSPNSYTVAFDANGGAGTMADMQFTFDEEQSLPANAFARENRFFAGWATAADGAAEYADGAVVSNLTAAADGVVTLYAVWADARIVFEANGGEGEVEGEMAPFFLFAGTEQTLPQGTFAMDGYFLLGWALTPDGEATLLDGDSTADIVAETGETVTLYAVWHEGEGNRGELLHRWSFNGDLVDSASGQDAVAVGTVTNDGQSYRLAGGNWGNSYIDLGSDVLPKDGSAATIEIWATKHSFQRWSRVFDFGTGSGDGNYIYMAWSGQYSSDSPVRIYAVGENVRDLGPYDNDREYHFAMVFNPGVNGVWDVKAYQQDATTGETIAIVTFSSSGTNWSLQNQGMRTCWLGHSRYSADRDANASYNEVRVWRKALTELELAANALKGPDAYIANAYAVRFDANGGAGMMAKQVYALGDDVMLPANAFARDGWSFLGWATSADGLVEYADGEAIDGGIDAANGATVTLYARWVEEAEIRFNANGGAGSMASLSFPIGYPFDLAFNGFSRVGYSFAGWATEPDGDAAYRDGETVTIEAEKGDAVDLFAVWTPNEYEVSFDPTEGAFAGAEPTLAVVFDSPYGGLPVATRTGYTLAWTLGGEAVTAETICATPSNHVLTASWTPNEYVVSFDANGGEVGTDSKTVTFGAAYGALPTPSLEWHSFRRWTLNGNRTISAESVVSTATDHTLVADWNLGIGGGAWEYPDGDGPITLDAPLAAASGDVVIPAEIDGRPIVAIGAAAFAGNTAITAITIPPSVTNIADGAFAGCTGLRSVSIGRMYADRLADLFPDATGTIEVVAFGDGIEAIPDNFFEGCTALKSMDIAKSVIDIGTNVFEACSELAVCVTNGLVFYQGWCLGFADGEVEEVEGVEKVEDLVVPESYETARSESSPHQSEIVTVRGIAAGAFEGETGITTVSLPESLRFIGAKAFAGCTRLEGIAVPEGVAKIDREAFRNCTRAQELSLPESLRIIGDGAFANCTRFTGVTLPFGVEEIGGCAFSNCWRVTSVSIPQSVERVGLGAFADCENITEATVPLHVAPMAELLPSAYDKLATVSVASLVVHGGSLGELAPPFEARQMVPRMFAGCAALEGIALPEWVCNISDGAFECCSAIEALALPDTVTNIGARACASMAALETVKFPASLATIGAEAFDGDAGIASLALPNGLQTIGERAFRGLSLLARADIPASVRVIGNDTFAGCGAIRSVSMPGDAGTVADVFPNAYDKITSAMIVSGDGSLGELAPPVLCAQLFAGCAALTRVELPQDLAEIGEQAFANCSALAEVGIPAAVTNIGASAFQNCSTLSSIALPRNLAAIRDGTFAGCASLAEIIIPESVGALGNGVFSGCTLLRSVRFVGNAPSYSTASGGPYAGVPSDAVSYVPDGSTGWDGIAFSQDLPRYWPNGTTYRIDWWDPTRLTVAFDPCDGTAPVEVEQVTGTSYVLPADPVRQGATFGGWWTSMEGGERVSATTRVTETRPQTLFAHWTPNRYFIHLDANGGSGSASPVEMTVGTAAALPACPFAYVAHAFMGWATTPDGPVVYADGATVCDLTYANNAAVTLYAVWAERDWSMPDYLDAPGLTFEAEGGLEWSGDWNDFKVGGASLTSGELLPSKIEGEWTNTVLRTTVLGEGSLSFWWKVSCEPEDVDWGEWYDFATFAVDGVEVARIAGESGWRQVECSVAGAGTHVLEWTFLRDDYDEDGAGYDNALWVDGVEWTPAPVTVAFAAGEGANGETPTGAAPAAVTQFAGYALALPGCGTLENAPYVFMGWTDGETVYAAGDTYVFGSEDVTLTAVWELKAWTLADAVDAGALAFTTGGTAVWAVDATTGWTNGVSAKSGVVANGQSSWIETMVTGGGTLAFRWKVMGGIYRNNPFAYAKVEVDGTQVASTHLTDGWEGQTLTVEGAGTHTIRWTYLRTSARSAEGDCAWIDGVAWEAAAASAAETTTTPEPVPYDWLVGNGLAAAGASAAAMESAANATAQNGRKVWECYVADLDPEDEDSNLVAEIAFDENGKPVVSIAKGESPNRKYTTQGARSLGGTVQWDDLEKDADWAAQGYRFFRVKVELPE